MSGRSSPLTLRTRDCRTYEICFDVLEDAEAVWESIKALCSNVKIAGVKGLYAFTRVTGEGTQPHKDMLMKNRPRRSGWSMYDPEAEFARMGLGTRSDAWRFTHLNDSYGFCPSYPSKIVVPAKISDTTLSYAVKYRSKGRIPGLVYLHWANLGSITRSSQPMVGITQGARSIQDEKLVEAIFSSHSQHSRAQAKTPVHSSVGSSPVMSRNVPTVYGAQANNIIIDARPTKNAYANSIKGAGSENMAFYRNCRKEYLGIDNIHVMRASLNGVYEALEEAETTGVLNRAALTRSNWLVHLSNILDGVLKITQTIHLNNSHVLVHCSDGWDRTSQLSALPQMCLDPYYRTAAGLAVLIEKDWMSYGHRFLDRAGHLCGDRIIFKQMRGDDATAQQAFLANVTKSLASSSHAYKETCPVFQQFLDCIYQLQRQFPKRFEWNETLLKRLQREAYANNFGTFLFNTEKDRMLFNAESATLSVWSEFFDEVQDSDGTELKVVLKPEFRNSAYDPRLDDAHSRESGADQGVLFHDPQDVRWWYSLFGLSDESMNGGESSQLPSKSSRSDSAGVESATIGRNARDIGAVIEPLISQTGDLHLVHAIDEHNSHTLSRPDVGACPSATSTPPTDSLLSPQSAGIARGPSAEFATSSSTVPLVASVQSSVQRFGWSTWKTMQRLGQEAALRLEQSQYQQSALSDGTSRDDPSRGRLQVVGDQSGLASSLLHVNQYSQPQDFDSAVSRIATPTVSAVQHAAQDRLTIQSSAAYEAAPAQSQFSPDAPSLLPPTHAKDYDPLGVGLRPASL